MSDTAHPIPDAPETDAVDAPDTTPVGRTSPGYWACQHEHVFVWGDEDWHRDASQGWSLTDPDMAPYGAPTHCPADWPDCPRAREYDMIGHPCMDSSILVGPCESPEHALKTVRDYKQSIDW